MQPKECTANNISSIKKFETAKTLQSSIMNGISMKSDRYKYYKVNIKYFEESIEQNELVECNAEQGP